MQQANYHGLNFSFGGPYIPDDGICPKCDRLLKNHQGVEMVLAERGLKYYDERTGQMVIRAGIPYCVCR